MEWVVLGVIVLVILGWLVFTYNGLVTARNRTQEAWSEIDVELKRRHDLIPNLVNTVQGYMGHERGTLEAVTNARAAAVAAGATGDPTKIGQAENMLSQSLRSLFAVSENYPDLKARERARLQALRLLPGGRGRPGGAAGQLRQHALGGPGAAGSGSGWASARRLRRAATSELKESLNPATSPSRRQTWLRTAARPEDRSSRCPARGSLRGR